ncbi:TonB-dependent receptor [Thauera aromatica K172]|uniref:TonB-dependent receptor n=1 Tax=Thauera aromatica K172 TaxID=44139 RepID=A0A2R4BIU4_THAAR|nr:TonB-dependent receptor [Thauera aromatica K172]
MLLLCGLAGAASAGEPEVTLPEVTVSAGKTDGKLSRTPASVTVIAGEEAERRGIDSHGELAQQVPNVYFTQWAPRGASLNVRGLGYSDDENDTQSGGFVIDGVPMFGNAAQSLFDVDQIEVVRGPQSTLYGMGAMSGLVVVRTREAESLPEGRLSLDLGAPRFGAIAATVGGALGDDTAARLSLRAGSDDGTLTNTRSGAKDGTSDDNFAGRLRLNHRLAGGGTLKFGLHGARDRGHLDMWATPAEARRHETSGSDQGATDARFGAAVAEYVQPLANGMTLTDIAGYVDSQLHIRMPVSALGGFLGVFNEDRRQFSNEFRLARQGESLDWLTGLWLARHDKEGPFSFSMRPFYASEVVTRIKADTVAWFGQTQWRFAPGWELTAGLRLERTVRKFDWSAQESGYADTDGDGMPDTPYSASPAVRGVRASSTVALPKLALGYVPAPGHYLYASYAQGYKPGGFNHHANSETEARAPYKVEHADQFELGWRGRWQGMSAGATVFHTRLRDQQVVENRPQGTFTANAARSHSQGVELEAALQATPTLQVKASAGYVRAVFDEYRNASIDYAGRQFPNTPKGSAGVSLHYAPGGAWEANASLTRIGKSTLFPGTEVENPAYTLLNASLAYRSGPWEWRLYGKNLLDAGYFTRALTSGLVVASPGRTVGIRLTREFF